MRFGWKNCEPQVKAQVDGLVDTVRRSIGHNLMGLYLHGSLALGCFNPGLSDIDVLGVTKHGLAVRSRRDLAKMLLRTSGAPAPIEISFLRWKDLHPWQFPTPYDFHYSEDWRGKFEKRLRGGDWPRPPVDLPTDADIAAHIVVVRNRGVRLWGRTIEQVLPEIPEKDYLASICADFSWAKQHIGEDPCYCVLNSCRVLGYVIEHRVMSKEEAGLWAAGHFPENLRGVATYALGVYRGNCPEGHFDGSAVEAFANFVGARLRGLLRAQALPDNVLDYSGNEL